ncbi:MAG: hypothetical protein R3F11_08880 [Verrucomicrobiales bacterium]
MKALAMVKAIRELAAARFALPITGIHGIRHWERVQENGLYLAKHAGADRTVVALFAFLHDCCRESEGSDPEHGLRAAAFARSLPASLLRIDAEQLARLTFACEFHEKGQLSDDPTIGACWDADRLDLGRVGRRPNPRFLSTERARKPSVIEWAYKRSRGLKAALKA